MKNLLMLDLVKAIYWFDESLQNGLKAKGWDGITRSQSLVLVNLANGETRSSRIAENVGVSRQAMSQMLAEMAAKDLIKIDDDPNDRRARIISFSPAAQPLREDANAILLDLEKRLEKTIGRSRMNAIRAGMAIDWEVLE
jgi:DNA-binding MarR family transcriptional regulator